MIEAIGGIEAVAQAAELAAPQPAQAKGDFGQWFVNELETVNHNMLQTAEDAKQLAMGQGDSLHAIMIHMEEAKLSLQLLAQVRNRMLDAYQEVMRMQV